MKIPVLRRALMATAIATSLVSGTMIAAPAQAQFGGIVYDPSNYAQNVLTAARTLQQINNQIQQIQNQATSLINEARNLASLPVSTIQTLQQQVDQTAAQPKQPFVLDEVHDFLDAGLPGRLQGVEIEQCSITLRWRSARDFADNQWMHHDPVKLE